MFDNLSEKLTDVLRHLRNRGRLTETDVDETLREIRVILLEADVNFRVARDLVNRIKERALGSQVLRSLSPGQQVVTVVYEELSATLGETGHQGLQPSPQAPSVALLVGLQGSGKTTTAAKLALNLRKQGHRVLLVATDMRRPAAIAQLTTLGKQLDIPVYQESTDSTVLAVAKNGIEHGKSLGATWVILDTGGRLHVDEPLMQELADLAKVITPAESLLVVDSMTGQDAVQVALEFSERINLTGLILSKLDGDARGGAALSITHMTGLPIKFVGTSERLDGLEPFYPDRMASRILGMGDVQTLVEMAQNEVDEQQVKDLQKKIRQATFNLEDFLQQLRQLQNMGSISQIMGMLPGFSSVSKQLPQGTLSEDRLKQVEAIILSMTPQERRNPNILNGSRRHRVALGSGTSSTEVNQVLNQFKQTQKLMRQMSTQNGRHALSRLMR